MLRRRGGGGGGESAGSTPRCHPAPQGACIALHPCTPSPDKPHQGHYTHAPPHLINPTRVSSITSADTAAASPLRLRFFSERMMACVPCRRPGKRPGEGWREKR